MSTAITHTVLQSKTLINKRLSLQTSLLWLFVSAAALALSGCKTADPEPKNGQTFTLSDSLKKTLKLDTARILPLQYEIKLTGKIAFDQNNVIKVFPLVGGNVVSVSVDLGDYVQKGQTLAVIQSGEIAEFEQQMMATNAQLLAAQKRLQIQEDMHKSGLSTESDLIQARTEVQILQANLKKLEEIIKIYNTNGSPSDYVVKAPISGFIVEKTIKPGLQIRSDNAEQLFTISALDEVWALANVYESDIPRIKQGLTAYVSTLSYPDKVYKGTIDKIFDVIDPDTRTLKARVRLPNADYKLKPDMFAGINVLSGSNEDMTAIATSALVFQNNKYYTLVYQNASRIEVRELVIKSIVQDVAYIASGLKPGEVVVAKHALLIFNELN